MKTADTSPEPPTAIARVLLVEDDPISLAFLSSVVRGTPAVVDCADSFAAAMALSGTQRHDLWLVDAHLPDGSGSDLLAQMRALHTGVPALAHTASTEPALHAALIAAGFDEVLVKPLPGLALQAAVRRALKSAAVTVTAEALATDPGADLPWWDDEAAARAMNFNCSHADALRRLFLGELPQARRLVITAANDGDHAAMEAHLHKLRASCGFVGAVRLAASVVALQRDPTNAALVDRFEQTAQATAVAAVQGASGSGGGGASASGAGAVAGTPSSD